MLSKWPKKKIWVAMGIGAAMILVHELWTSNWSWSSKSSTRTTTLQQTARVHSSVIIPACDKGWSTTVHIPSGHSVRWSWTVQARYSYDGSDFKPHVPNTYPNAEAFQYCSQKTQHVDKAMPLTWDRL